MFGVYALELSGRGVGCLNKSKDFPSSYVSNIIYRKIPNLISKGALIGKNKFAV